LQINRKNNFNKPQFEKIQVKCRKTALKTQQINKMQDFNLD